VLGNDLVDTACTTPDRQQVRPERIIAMMPDYVIRHDKGLPDEVLADNYAEQDGDLVFTRDGEEVFRLPMAVVVSVAPKDES
jgi:hypothetical protein